MLLRWPDVETPGICGMSALYRSVGDCSDIFRSARSYRFIVVVKFRQIYARQAHACVAGRAKSLAAPAIVRRDARAGNLSYGEFAACANGRAVFPGRNAASRLATVCW